MKKTLLAPLMALLIATSATATGLVVTNVSAGAEEPTANWTDGLTYNAEYGYGGGRGVGGDPYLISTPEHLAQLAVNLNYDKDITANYSQGKYFKLTNDIDVSGKNWTPIGNKIGVGRNNTFYGAMDFNGYEVSGISHTGYDGQFFGFFGAFSIGWVKNPKISYGDVTVNYTGGEGSVVDNSGVTSVASFGGVAGVMIGGIIGYDDGSDLYVDVDIDGDVSFTNTVANTRGYHGGVVGYLIGGVIGNEAEEGSTDISVEVGENGSMNFINNTGELIYAGGLFGHGNTNGVIVGNNNEVGNGDVTVSFVNYNKNESEAGFYVESNYTGESGLIAGEANYTIGNLGSGSGDVTISATNYGTVHYLYKGKKMSYSGGLFAQISGLKGTKGTGDVAITLDNYGMIKAENIGAEETRFGGISGNTSGAVVGIDNVASNGRVFMSVINHGDAKMFRADNWNYYTAMHFGYTANSVVGTKGTGTAEFVLQTKVDNFYNNSGKLVWLFVNTQSNSQFGSLNGGETTDLSKSFCWMLTEERVGTGTHGFRFDWQKSAGYEGKIPAGETFLWEVVGANADGAVFALRLEDGYGFNGFADGSAVTTDANGDIIATLTQSAGLPTPNVIDLGEINVDFSAVDYTGEVLQPTVEGYTVVALNEAGEPLNATLPATYNVYGATLYADGVFVGTKKFDTAQQFVINKLANVNVVDTQKVTMDANAETYMVTEDLEIATDAEFTNVIANSGSLTEYKGSSLYVRIKETATHNASAGVEVAINAYTVTIAENAGVTVSTTETKTSFLNGAYYEFTVAVNEGYEVSTLVVKANGVEVTAEGDIYYILVTADTTITVEGVSLIVYYNVTVPEYDFATVVPVREGQTTVKEGESFMFAVETEEEVIVKVNGVEVQASSGIYTIENVSADIAITVEKVVQPEPPADDSSDTTSSDTTSSDTTSSDTASSDTASSDTTSSDTTQNGPVVNFDGTANSFGCGSVVGAASSIVALFGAAVVAFNKKKED